MTGIRTDVARRTLCDEEGIAAFMQATARQQPGGRLVLDVGARDGRSSQPYTQPGSAVISLDIVMLGLSYGLKNGRIQAGRAVVADGRFLPFRDAAFDLVSSRWFLHEFPDQATFLGEIKRVVRDDGAVAAVDFAAPGADSQAFLNRYILQDEHARTCSEFTQPWVAAGLEVETLEWHTWQLEENGRIRAAACGPEGKVPEGVKEELRLTCDDRHVFLQVPMAFVIARKRGGSVT